MDFCGVRVGAVIQIEVAKIGFDVGDGGTRIVILDAQRAVEFLGLLVEDGDDEVVAVTLEVEIEDIGCREQDCVATVVSGHDEVFAVGAGSGMLILIGALAT